VTGNTRLLHDAVKPHVSRVVAVDPNQVKVISHSVKNTDSNDARNLALYLAKDLLLQHWRQALNQFEILRGDRLRAAAA